MNAREIEQAARDTALGHKMALMARAALLPILEADADAEITTAISCACAEMLGAAMSALNSSQRAALRFAFLQMLDQHLIRLDRRDIIQ